MLTPLRPGQFEVDWINQPTDDLDQAQKLSLMEAA
jgi:hypothetical protein